MEPDVRVDLSQLTPAGTDRPKRTAIARVLLDFSVSSSLTLLVTFGVDVVSQIALGRLSATHLAAGSLGSLVCNITGVFVIMGLLTAQDTLSSQAFGAKDFRALGEVLQRAVVLVLLCMLPISYMWLRAEDLLVLCEQPRDVAQLAGQFAAVSVWSLFPRVCYEALKRFLQAQGVFRPLVWCSVVVLVAHVAFLYVLMFSLGLGFLGNALANVLSAWLNLAVLAAYVAWYKPYHPGTWNGVSVAAVSVGWGEFLRLGIPGTVMLCVEWWCFELLSLRAGTIGTNELAAMNILNTIASVAFMLSMGLSTASQTVLGNALGANKPRTAVAIVAVGLAMSMGLAGLICMGLFLVRHTIADVFTNDHDVAKLVAANMLWVCVFEIMDSAQEVGQGLMRGAGKQNLGAVVLFVSCYGITLPCAWWWARTRGVEGLWMGMDFGYTFVLFGLLAALSCVDWRTLANEVHLRQKQHLQPWAGPHMGNSVEMYVLAASSSAHNGSEDSDEEDASSSDEEEEEEEESEQEQSDNRRGAVASTRRTPAGRSANRARTTNWAALTL